MFRGQLQVVSCAWHMFAQVPAVGVLLVLGHDFIAGLLDGGLSIRRQCANASHRKAQQVNDSLKVLPLDQPRLKRTFEVILFLRLLITSRGLLYRITLTSKLEVINCYSLKQV